MTPPARGLEALLTGLIDYAGMFPPARLSLEDAFDTFIRDSRGEDAWMLAGFVLPTGRMADAADLLEEKVFEAPLRFSALGRGGEGWDDYFDGLSADIQAVADFRTRLAGRAVVPTLENRLPGAELDFRIRSDALVEAAAEKAAAAGLTPYFEVPFDERWNERSARVIRSVHKITPRLTACYKIRTGGVVKDAFPTPRQLAWAMREAAEYDVAFKCTAGLHHPIRRFDPDTGAVMHGFINVFTGAVLAAAHDLDVDGLERLLSEEDPAAFHFDADGIRWETHRAGIEQIRAVRRHFAVSVGSCSFDEPREDLEALGWM